MTPPRGLVLADDATGALECSSLLATLNLDVSISLSHTPPQPHAAGILVVDTESRHLSAPEAADRVSRWADGFPGPIFKKTDSTLRGHIAAELLALEPVVYVPAYPALGRTVRQGRLFVHGVPVHQTDFARDPRHPVISSVIADLFPRPIEIHDGETDADLARIAESLRGRDVAIAGPAGFLPFWVKLHAFAVKPATPLPRAGTWLVVCGSRHPQARRQARIAATQGIATLLSREEEQSPEQAAADLGERAAGLIRRERPEGVLIMGGDTAWALWQALGISTLTPLPEVLPGIAASQSRDTGLVFITKAGGFGDDNLVQTAIRKFQ